MNHAILSLGSNVGDRSANLVRAIRMLEDSGCLLVQRSSIYVTSPWGNTNQNAFYNQVIEIETGMEAESFMRNLLSIEEVMGRTRRIKWEPRLIDIDILFFNSDIIQTAELKIPHPHLQERRFVLAPLAEILPGFRHPVSGKTAAELLHDLTDDSTVEKISVISQS